MRGEEVEKVGIYEKAAEVLAPEASLEGAERDATFRIRVLKYRAFRSLSLAVLALAAFLIYVAGEAGLTTIHAKTAILVIVSYAAVLYVAVEIFMVYVRLGNIDRAMRDDLARRFGSLAQLLPPEVPRRGHPDGPEVR